jgi:K+ transporter
MARALGYATGHGPPLPGDVIGIMSLTFWALLLTLSLKYVVFVFSPPTFMDCSKAGAFTMVLCEQS